MRRVVVLGGLGFFGAAAVDRLRADGVQVLAASRGRGADLRVDAESRASLKTALKAYDVVLDAAGPFQGRTTTLVESALEIGFDVVDLSDSLDYSYHVTDLRLRIEAAGIRVLTSCSSVSAVSAAAVRLSGLEKPVRLSVLLRPATRATAHRATARSLLESVGRPIRMLHAGKLADRPGWRDSRTFLWSGTGRRARGRLSESADALHLPPIWPSLQQIDFYVDVRVAGFRLALDLAARMEPVRRVVASCLPFGIMLCRMLGSNTGGIQFEVEGADGRTVTLALSARRRSFLVAVAPAVLAVRALAQGRFEPSGLVAPDRQVEPRELLGYLGGLGIDLVTVRHGRQPVP